MWKFTKQKTIILIIFAMNAIHHFAGAYVESCSSIDAFCVVSISQKIYIFTSFLLLPVKIILYPIDIYVYDIVQIEIFALFFSLILYWILLNILMNIYKKNKFIFFVVLSIFASITLGIAFS